MNVLDLGKCRGAGFLPKAGPRMHDPSSSTALSYAGTSLEMQGVNHHRRVAALI